MVARIALLAASQGAPFGSERRGHPARTQPPWAHVGDTVRIAGTISAAPLLAAAGDGG
jgi:hypothetical protein